MADILKIYQRCPKCKGIGTVELDKSEDESGQRPPSEVIVCPVCNGDKELFWGEMREEELENPA